MLCHFCGSNIPDNADSCPACGKSLGTDATPVSAVETSDVPATVPAATAPGPNQILSRIRQKCAHLWGWLVQRALTLAPLIGLAWRTVTSRTKHISQEAYSWIRTLFQRASFRTRLVAMRLWDTYPIGRSFARCLLVLALSYICWLAIVRRWQLGKPDKGLVAQIPMFIGGAITGLIAISVALTLFAIQQLAEANGPTVMEEYARDKRRIFIYWSLTVCALVPFVIAFVLISKLSLDLIFAQIAILYISFELLNLHFHQAVRFSNPRYRIDLLLKRGTRQIGALRRMQDDVERRINRTGIP